MENTATSPHPATVHAHAAADPGVQRIRFADEEGGTAGLCIFLGVICLLLGLFFLVVAPGEAVSGYDPVAGFSSRTVVNLQRLAMGQTFTICGAVFLAAAIRPRR